MQAVSEVLVSTLPPSHLFLELSMVLSLPSSLESEEMPTWMAKQAPGVLSIVFPKGGVGWENSSLSAPGNKVSPLKGKAVLPVTGRGSPAALQPPLSKLAIPT